MTNHKPGPGEKDIKEFTTEEKIHLGHTIERMGGPLAKHPRGVLKGLES